MTSVRFSPIAALVVALASQAGATQTYGQSPYVQQSLTPDADALAEQMRVLAANPSDVNAMVRAGELTLKLDDPTAAAGFFARAERIDPSNPRIKARKGTLLVMAGRPGEALQRFAEAEALRGDVRQFAADRALAYDLIGEQERAQREYRLALREGPADETLRRYALSLGISGQRDLALQTIDPLLRRSDRGAWRARAFILAMTGDASGAERIAASMMPGGLGQGLQPFFDRLPRLGPADRAFAVHFGEVRATPQRLADARMVPRLPVLTPEPGRPITVAALAIPQPVRDDRRDRRNRRRSGREPIDVVTVAPPVPLPQPPAYQPPVVTAYAQAYAPTTVAPGVPATVAPVVLASNPMLLSAVPVGRSDIAPIVRPPSVPESVATASSATVAPGSDVAVRSVAPASRAAAVATVRPVAVETKTVAPPVQLAAATLPVATAPTIAAPVVAAAPAPVAAASTILPPVPGPMRGEDSILAKIVANITVPGSELEDAAVAPAPAAEIAADDAQAGLIAEQKAADRIANAKALAEARGVEQRADTAVAPVGEAGVVRRRGETARQFEARKLTAAAEKAPTLTQRRGESAKAFEARKLAATKTEDEAPVLTRRRGETAKAFEARKLAAAKPTEDAPAPVRKRGETAKQFAARQAAADDAPTLTRKPGESARAFEARKLAAAKPGAKKEPKSAEPARIWVQVSSGANEGDLDKAWDKVRKDAPVAMRGRSGWMTPWRATNRVLAGPFKSDAEARGFVNALGKEGVSAFSFTSEAGQKVSRLGGK